MSWQEYDFQPGERYLLSEIVGTCDERIRQGRIIWRESKAELVRVMEKHAPATIIWSPKRANRHRETVYHIEADKPVPLPLKTGY